MKKFIFAALPGILVALVYLSYGEYILFRVGENIPITLAVKQQMESKEEFYYYKTAFVKGKSQYKYEYMQARKPKILILGQSTVLNFRDFFFHPYESQFYNTGHMASDAQDFKYVASLIRQGKVKKPDFIVLGVDFSFILKDPRIKDENALEDELDVDPVYDFNQHLKVIQDIYFKKELRQKNNRKVGIGYKGIEGIGYRKDGSFSYMWELQRFLEDSIHIEGDLKEHLIKKTRIFKSPITVDEKKKAAFIEALNEYTAMGIELVLYFPPLSDTFFTLAEKDKEFVNLFNKFLVFQNELKSMGYDIIPFNTPSQLNLNDYYMNNSNHPGDMLVAQQFSTYCKSPDRKNKFIDKIEIKYLDSLIHSPKSNCLSFMKDTLVIK